MSRCAVALGLLSALAVVPQACGQDVFLRPEGELAPAESAVRAALAQPPAQAPLNDELKGQIRILAQNLAYPLTQRKMQDTPKAISQFVGETDGRVGFYYGKDAKNPPVQDEFASRYAAELERVTSPPDQANIARVNAARLLARLAYHSKREQVADLAVKIINDPKQVDGARYYALQAIKELLAEIKESPAIKDEKRRAEVVAALVGFIERKPPYTPATPEEADGLRVVRREAIRALAEVRVAQVAGKPKGHAALALCRVVGSDESLDPEPRLDERMEAAIGLCRMAATKDGPVDPEYAAHFIGRFLYDFLKADRGNRGEPRKVYAARVREDLKAFAGAHADNVVVKSVFNQTQDVLQAMERDGTGRDVVELSEWLEKNPPKASLYKGDPQSVVTPRKG
jgi:hypothetical protein